MTRLVLLAMSALWSVSAHSQDIGKCIAVEVDGGVANDVGEAAVLDMQGKWHIVSRPKLIAVLTNSPNGSVERCIVDELLMSRDVTEIGNPDLRCRDDKNYNYMQSIIDRDPIMRACRSRVVCLPGDTCS